MPKELLNNPILYGECLSGALYWNDFLHLARKVGTLFPSRLVPVSLDIVGFKDPRLVDSSSITVNNKDIENLVGNIKFFSATYRLFKLKGLEYDCEDYGQAVIYHGKRQGETRRNE